MTHCYPMESGCFRPEQNLTSETAFRRVQWNGKCAHCSCHLHWTKCLGQRGCGHPFPKSIGVHSAARLFHWHMKCQLVCSTRSRGIGGDVGAGTLLLANCTIKGRLPDPAMRQNRRFADRRASSSATTPYLQRRWCSGAVYPWAASAAAVSGVARRATRRASAV